MAIFNNGLILQFGKINYKSKTISACKSITVNLSLPLTLTTWKTSISNCNATAFTCCSYNNESLSQVQFAYSNKNNKDSSSFEYIQFICIGY